jgi:GNAT superfamily N-acetyltransferase
MNDAQPTLRDAVPADASALADLAGQLGYPVAAEEIVARLAALAAGGAGAVLVACVGPRVVAWINVAETRTLEYGAFAEVLGLVVDAPARGAGAGAALLAAAERWARARGLREMRVRSNVVRDRAHAFYRREGYAEVKRQVLFRKRLDEPGT